MFVTAQDGTLVNIALARDAYVTKRWVVARFEENDRSRIAECDSEEEAEAVLAEIQDALAARGMCRVLMSIPPKTKAPAEAEAR